jgi:hypothetical protein
MGELCCRPVETIYHRIPLCRGKSYPNGAKAHIEHLKPCIRNIAYRRASRAIKRRHCLLQLAVPCGIGPVAKQLFSGDKADAL